MATTNDDMQSQAKPRISPLEYRNTDLVSRLLAATPPYLYNMSMAPNTYFFSEMLRSFVQAKTDRTTASTIARRSRKRSWTQTRTPLETSKSHKNEAESWKPEKHYYDDNKPPINPQDAHKDKNFSIFHQPSSPPTQQHPSPQTSSANENSSNLILPPPPPIWYPPLYSTPPYGIDPLHFFIDLRVSGHIYDRKKALEKEESQMMMPSTIPNLFANPETPSTKPSNVFKTSKHTSAFSVPVKNHPINLSKVEANEYKPLKFDVKSLGLESTCNKTGVNYVMNNIERVYKDLHGNYGVKMEDDEDVAKKKQAIEANIDFEAVVDYMNKKHNKGLNQNHSDDASHDLDNGSVVEVVDIQDELGT